MQYFFVSVEDGVIFSQDILKLPDLVISMCLIIPVGCFSRHFQQQYYICGNFGPADAGATYFFSCFFSCVSFFSPSLFSLTNSHDISCLSKSPARSSSLSCKSGWNSLVQSHSRLFCDGPLPKCNDSVMVATQRSAHLLTNIQEFLA